MGARNITPKSRRIRPATLMTWESLIWEARLRSHRGPSAVSSTDLYIRPALHPGWRRFSSLTDAQYARSSRLACREPRRPRCTDLLNSPH